MSVHQSIVPSMTDIFRIRCGLFAAHRPGHAQHPNTTTSRPTPSTVQHSFREAATPVNANSCSTQELQCSLVDVRESAPCSHLMHEMSLHVHFASSLTPTRPAHLEPLGPFQLTARSLDRPPLSTDRRPRELPAPAPAPAAPSPVPGPADAAPPPLPLPGAPARGSPAARRGGTAAADPESGRLMDRTRGTCNAYSTTRACCQAGMKSRNVKHIRSQSTPA